MPKVDALLNPDMAAVTLFDLPAPMMLLMGIRHMFHARRLLLPISGIRVFNVANYTWASCPLTPAS